MNNFQIKLISLFFTALLFSNFGFSQDTVNFDLTYQVNKVYPPISITRTQLKEAQTLLDLNRHFKPSWIRTYISTEIMASEQGNKRKVVSKNDTLRQAQKDLMTRADVGTDIAVKVQYIPENTLKNKEPKEINFTFTIDPEREAQYVGGAQHLQAYLKENIMDKVTAISFKQYNLTAVKFTIDEDGQIVDTHVVESSKDEKIDELLVETICKMPSWKPAAYANGMKVKQDFVLTVGDMTSCVVNLLNIRRLEVE